MKLSLVLLSTIANAPLKTSVRFCICGMNNSLGHHRLSKQKEINIQLCLLAVTRNNFVAMHARITWTFKLVCGDNLTNILVYIPPTFLTI